MAGVEITPSVLNWARRRLDLTPQVLAKRVSTKPERVLAWEDGSETPTLRQADRLARILRIPVGYLFLESHPIDELPVADFRFLPEAERGKASPDLIDVVDDALRKRDLYRQIRMEEGYPPLEFVGRFTADDATEEVAADIRRVLGIEDHPAQGSKSWEDHLRGLIRKAESAGILVLRSGIVGLNTHRPLSVEEFRGFAVSDSYAPLVFINSKDAKAAQIFTLGHELTHIWLGTSGVSNPPFKGVDQINDFQAIERFSNRVSAEILTPRDSFLEMWRTSQDDLSNVERLARYFRVSNLVVIRRAFELDLIDWDEFQTIFNDEMAQAKKREIRRGDGGDFYKLIRSRNSARFVGTLLEAVKEGRILYTDAARALNVHPTTLTNIIVEFT